MKRFSRAHIKLTDYGTNFCAQKKIRRTFLIVCEMLPCWAFPDSCLPGIRKTNNNK